VLEFSQLVNGEIVIVGLVELVWGCVGLGAVRSLMLSLLLPLLDTTPHFKQTVDSVHIGVKDLPLFF
jgi:hypothetical protein